MRCVLIVDGDPQSTRALDTHLTARHYGGPGQHHRPEELTARLRAILRRPPVIDEPGTIDIAGYHLDLAAHTAVPVTGKGQPLHFTPTEWRILIPLLHNPRHLVTGRQLLRDV